MEDADQGAAPPGPIVGLDMLTEMGVELAPQGLLLMPMLIGIKGDPDMGLVSKWKTHMIGYAIRKPPEAKTKMNPESEEVLDEEETMFARWFGRNEEE
jgi:hypothetical protein